MKKRKKIIVIISLLTFLILVIPIINSSLNEDKEIKDCKNYCFLNKKKGIAEINSNYKECCKSCDGKEKQKCMFSCKDKQSYLLKKLEFIYENCEKNCLYKIKNSNLTCMNGTYKLGEIFLDDCNICRCEIDSKIKCRKTPFCNFEDITINKTICEKNNGLFQQLCNGPYFDIVCSKYNFCLCDGNNNYSCPENYTCIKNFTLSITRKGNTILGWKTLLGKNLGDIGICAKNPELKKCGNNICENKISRYNDISETNLNCPIDCK
ncbi:MAG: hypothetical protein QXW97_01440 [Candidatus Pacearchaeota archaeon]